VISSPTNPNVLLYMVPLFLVATFCAGFKKITFLCLRSLNLSTIPPPFRAAPASFSLFPLKGLRGLWQPLANRTLAEEALSSEAVFEAHARLPPSALSRLPPNSPSSVCEALSFSGSRSPPDPFRSTRQESPKTFLCTGQESRICPRAARQAELPVSERFSSHLESPFFFFPPACELFFRGSSG